MDSNCHAKSLVVSETCEAHYCPDCKTVLLSVGAVFVRFKEDDFRKISSDLRLALLEMNKSRQADLTLATETTNVTNLHS